MDSYLSSPCLAARVCAAGTWFRDVPYCPAEEKKAQHDSFNWVPVVAT